MSGMCLAALGTDTGGSIRIPASLCGAVGIKPTYGRVSLRGILPLSWNLDHAGPITKSVEDAAFMLQVISGYDPLDPASVKTLPGDYQSHLKDGMDGRKVAVAVGDFIEKSDPEVLKAYYEAERVFESLGAHLEEVNVSWLREAALANGLMTTSDGAAFHRERLKEHPDWFGADVRQRLEIGAAYTSSEYALARRTQAEARRRLENLFEVYDVLVLPTTPIAAPLIDGDDALERIKGMTESPKLGNIYTGKAVRVEDYGVFVEIAPGLDGLVHVSQLDTEPVRNVRDQFKIGDDMMVMVTGIDDAGKIRLSRQAVLEGWTVEQAQERDRGGRGGGGDRGGDRGGPRRSGGDRGGRGRDDDRGGRGGYRQRR